MKYRILVTIASTMIVNTAYADWPKWEDTKIYLGAEIGMNESRIESGGFNTIGAFKNTRNDKDTGGLYSVKMGVDFLERWRVDIGYRQSQDQEYTTGSFKLQNPAFFYASDIESKALMLTAYYDFFKFEKMSFYGGAGIGISKTKASTNDTVVRGSDSETNFAWQAELGADYPFNDSFMINAGIRYVDLGETKVDLKTEVDLKGDETAEGDFTADLTSKEVFLGLQYMF
ncbi:MAG: porin family protein [gamma proteobacterium symbiont of Bathyaustriella thionipta]|nr:porin family protein [gamma proteobacterium symbiont of Bathyaustriella thionipta]